MGIQLQLSNYNLSKRFKNVISGSGGGFRLILGKMGLKNLSNSIWVCDASFGDNLLNRCHIFLKHNFVIFSSMWYSNFKLYFYVYTGLSSSTLRDQESPILKG